MDMFYARSLIAFSKDCFSIQSHDELEALVAETVAILGFDHFAMARIPLPHETLDKHFIMNGWPDGWYERYLQHNFFRHDPIVSLSRSSDDLILWSEAILNYPLSPKAMQVMQEAAAFGLVDGITIPIASHLGFSTLLSLAGGPLSLSPAQRSLLHVLANSIHSRLLDLDTSHLRPSLQIELTRRESECLSWCLAGYSDRQISELTHSSPRTIQNHLSNIQRKLGVRNRPQMVAEAFRHGYWP
ncbi:LuxR family transcriptional regulator [Neorhizobium sp. NCHU2750]|uniref:LuxR family transcriptional regulator n=1 Tax=Neorhizobium sp. NCHU2750 TaxID=1825976 RepID=UPI000EB66E5E|nr:transcriptional regulator [Neorhizobium sp. NCHU2750]